MKFYVYSRHRETDTTPQKDVLELTRTDERTARDDAALIQDILHRTSWVQKNADESRDREDVRP